MAELSLEKALLESLTYDIKESCVDHGFNGPIYHYGFKDSAVKKIQAYADSAVALEREACAKELRLEQASHDAEIRRILMELPDGTEPTIEGILKAIRARGEQKK